MSDPLKNYLKAHRKLCGFTQSEVAYLIGHENAHGISRYESFRQIPDLLSALAYEVIFDVPARDLFAGVFNEVELKTQNRAYLLARKLEARGPTSALANKIERLHLIYLRALEEGEQNII